MSSAAERALAAETPYFAYGSNMLARRLHERIPGACWLAVAVLAQHELRFDKHGSQDGSGKCWARYTGETSDLVWGVLWGLTEPERRDLDRIEGVGVGYEVERCQVKTLAGEEASAVLYATDPAYVDPALRPFDWYRELVLAGALENGFPEPYLERIRAVEVVRDHDRERAR